MSSAGLQVKIRGSGPGLGGQRRRTVPRRGLSTATHSVKEEAVDQCSGRNPTTKPRRICLVKRRRRGRLSRAWCHQARGGSRAACTPRSQKCPPEDIGIQVSSVGRRPAPPYQHGCGGRSCCGQPGRSRCTAAIKQGGRQRPGPCPEGDPSSRHGDLRIGSQARRLAPSRISVEAGHEARVRVATGRRWRNEDRRRSASGNPTTLRRPAAAWSRAENGFDRHDTWRDEGHLPVRPVGPQPERLSRYRPMVASSNKMTTHRPKFRARSPTSSRKVVSSRPPELRDIVGQR